MNIKIERTLFLGHAPKNLIFVANELSLSVDKRTVELRIKDSKIYVT